MNLKKSFLLVLVFSTILFAQTEKLPAIVSLSWLKNNYNNPNLVIVDLREESDYLKGHLKGAVNIPGLKNLFDDKFFMPKLEKLKELFSLAGIDNDSLVVSYDNGEFIWAARFYWILKTLGHENIALLKVAYGKELQENFPIEYEKVLPIRKEFIPRVDITKVQTKLSTLMSIGKKTIIDGRKTSHYEGVESFAKRFGHIPTAKNYACTQNFQVSSNGNRMKDLDELRDIYKDIPKDKEIILYCDGGAEAALNFVVLQELGFKASVYDGSWLEWGNDLAVPIENPSKE